MAIYLHAHEIRLFEKLVNIHGSEQCANRVCIIHNPLSGPWRRLPMAWRNDRKIFERVCSHSVGHPDPSQRAYWVMQGQPWQNIHGCCEDQCCVTWWLFIQNAIEQ